MKHYITTIDTFILERKQWISLIITGKEDSVNLEFSTVSKLTGLPSVLELEILIGCYIEPISYFKFGERMSDGKKALAENKFPKEWTLRLCTSLGELRMINQQKVLNFKTLYDTHVFAKGRRKVVRVRTTDERVYFEDLRRFEQITGVKEAEFHLLSGAFVSPVMYKEGEYHDFFGNFNRVKQDIHLLKTGIFECTNQ